jgi:hypothetical protein
MIAFEKCAEANEASSNEWHAVRGLHKSNPVDPQLETARLQPLSLPLDPSRKTGYKLCSLSHFHTQLAPLRRGEAPGDVRAAGQGSRNAKRRRGVRGARVHGVLHRG